MKTVFFIFVSFCIPFAAFATMTSGSFQAIDAYCTNPQHQYSPDEQAYIDSLRGKGSCVDHLMQSPPCFADYYTFSGNSTGDLRTLTTDLPGISCLAVTPLTYSEKTAGSVSITFGDSKTYPHSSNADDSITCSGEYDPGTTVDFQYQAPQDQLLLSMKSEADCGDFVLKMKSVKEVPQP